MGEYASRRLLGEARAGTIRRPEAGSSTLPGRLVVRNASYIEVKDLADANGLALIAQSEATELHTEETRR